MSHLKPKYFAHNFAQHVNFIIIYKTITIHKFHYSHCTKNCHLIVCKSEVVMNLCGVSSSLIDSSINPAFIFFCILLFCIYIIRIWYDSSCAQINFRSKTYKLAYYNISTVWDFEYNWIRVRRRAIGMLYVVVARVGLCILLQYKKT